MILPRGSRCFLSSYVVVITYRLQPCQSLFTGMLYPPSCFGLSVSLALSMSIGDTEPLLVFGSTPTVTYFVAHKFGHEIRRATLRPPPTPSSAMSSTCRAARSITMSSSGACSSRGFPSPDLTISPPTGENSKQTDMSIFTISLPGQKMYIVIKLQLIQLA